MTAPPAPTRPAPADVATLLGPAAAKAYYQGLQRQGYYSDLDDASMGGLAAGDGRWAGGRVDVDARWAGSGCHRGCAPAYTRRF